jgi:predicted RNA-binding Zn-ribbon protein involved in translation (DUF1610 family)
MSQRVLLETPAGAVIACPRCGVLLIVESAECCWYCGKYICLACWEALGRCDHPEADAIDAAVQPRESARTDPPMM